MKRLVKTLVMPVAIMALLITAGCSKSHNFWVTFHPNGGYGNMEQQFFEAGVPQALNPNKYTLENCSFVNWNTVYDGSGTSYADREVITVSEAIHLYAQWNANYVVTFFPNGGDGEMQPQQFSSGEAQTLKTNTFTYDEYHSFKGWNTKEDGSGFSYNDAQEIKVYNNMTLYAQWDFSIEGAVNRRFSVSGTKQVYFSQGNLQYKASTDTWRFADSQLEYIGIDNSNISDNYDGWIDLFGWGTGDCPTKISTISNSYSTFVDWGINAVINGGNVANTWRTLKREEWDFLLFSRTTASGLRFVKAIVNGVRGIVVLPDDWDSSHYLLYGANLTNVDFLINEIILLDWKNNLEAYGAVFLPAAGYRRGISIYGVNTIANYWSCNYNGNAVNATSDSMVIGNNDRSYGQSVRLVYVSD